MKITMNTNNTSICDDCSNCDICKYKEEAQDRENQLAEFYKGAWTQYLNIKSCKYKQYATNWRSAEICTGQKYVWNGETYVNTGDPPFIYNEGSTCNTTE